MRAATIGLFSAATMLAAVACVSLSGLTAGPSDGGGDDAGDAADARGPSVDGSGLDGSNPDSGIVCPKGKGDCDGDPSNGCETDVTSNPKACGQCAHDCKGQECSGSACSPIVVESGRDTPRSLVVGIGLAWIEGPAKSATIMASAGGSLFTIATGQSDPSDLALDGTTLYWPAKGDGRVLSCDVPCAATPRTMWTAPAGITANAVTFDTTNLYWTAIGAASGAVFTTPKGTPITDGGGRTLGTGLLIGSDTLVSGTSNVWYADTRDGGTVRGVSKGFGLPTNALSGMGPLGSFYNSSGIIYFVVAGPSGSVHGCDVPECVAPPVYAIAQPNPVDVVSDGVSVYWATQGLADTDGAIWKCPRVGPCTPQMLAGAQAKPSSIDLDSTFVYWTCSGDGTIRKTPK